MSNVLAIVPARVSSKGIPNKNFRPLAGESPLSRAIWCASQVAGAVVVTTDHTPFAGHTVHTNVHVVIRPPALAQDDTPMIDVVRHALDAVPGPPEQMIILLQPTQPLREPKHLEAAIALLRSTGADSVVSVVEVPLALGREWQAWIAPDGLLIHDWDNVPACRQDLAHYHVRDGTVYAFWRKTLASGTLYGQTCQALVIPPEDTCALDEMEDWHRAERLLREREAKADSDR